MSDTLTPFEREQYGVDQPYLSLTDWLKKKAIPAVRGGAEGILPGLVAMGRTDPTQEGAAGYVPGIAAKAYEGVTAIKDLVQMVPRLDVLGALPERQSITLPGEDTARAITHNVGESAIRDYAPTAESPSQAAGQRVVTETLMGGPPVPGLVGKLPTAAREAVMWLAPSMAFPKLTLAANTGIELLKPDSGSDATQSTATPVTTPTLPAPIPEPTPLPIAPRNMDYDSSTGLIIDRDTGDVIPDPGIEWTNAGMLAAGIAGLVLAAGSRRAGTFLREAQLAKFGDISTEFNTALGGMTAPKVAAPVPGVIASDRAATALTDRSIPLQRYAEAVAPNPAASTELKNKVALLDNDSVFAGKLQSFANTGVDRQTGFKMVPWQRHWERVSALDDAAKEQYTLARNAADELENRLRNNGVPHNFPTQSTADLQLAVANARSSAPLAAMLDERRLMSDQMADFMRARGMITPQEATRLKSQHRDFLPSSNAKGIIDNPLTSRDLTPEAGLQSIKIPAWELDKQHVEAVYRAAEHNDLVNAIVKPGLARQAANPREAKIFEDVATKTDEFTLAYRDAGQLKYVRVNSPEMHAWIEGGPTQVAAFGGMMNYLRHMLQSTTLGPLAGAVTGNITAPYLAGYNGVIASIIRPKGSAFGLIDKGLQKAGFKFGWPGDLTGAAVGMPYAVVADAASMGIKALGEALEPGAGMISAALRRRYGDAAINAVQTNLERRYAATVLGERRAVGNIGSAGQGSTELPMIQPGAENWKSSVLNNTVPDLFRNPNSLLNIPIGIGRLMPSVVKTTEFLNHMHRLVTESHASHFYRMNKGVLPPNTLNRETRRLTGDIGEHGSSTLARGVANYIPWGNAAVQGVRATANAASNSPVQMAAGMTTALGSLALGSVWLALARGPEYVKHLREELDSERVGSQVTFHTGTTPDEYSHIKLPQEMRGPYAAAVSMMFDLLGDPTDPEIKRMSLAGMTDFFQKHVSRESQKAVVEGLASPLTLGLPPLANAGLAAVGQKLQNNWLARSINGEPVITPTTGKSNLPGVDKEIDPLFESEYGKMFRDVTGAIFGGLATQGWASNASLYGSGKFAYDWTKDKWFALGSVGEQWIDNFQSKQPLGNMVWQNSMPLSISTPVTDRVNAKTQALGKLSGVKSDVMNEGFTRSRGVPVPIAPSQAGEIPQDPTMFGLYVVLSKLAPKITAQTNPANDVRKQIDAARIGGYDPKTRTQIINTLNRDYQQKMRLVDEQLSAFEGYLSQMVGGRVVEIDKIDWKKGPEQFTAPSVE
jgi:hypothetical protein